MEVAVIIPAVKKNVAFTNDLVKKLGDAPLIQRAIDLAQEISGLENIYVVTDSEEIQLLCRRNGINDYYRKKLRLQPEKVVESLSFFLSQIAENYKDMIVLSPYAPMLKADEIHNAYAKFKSRNNGGLLIPVKRALTRAFRRDKRSLREALLGEAGQDVFIESQAFQIISSELVQKGHQAAKVEPLTYELDRDLIEIRSYEDWWVCEKLLRRKRIIFRVVGDEQVGMGHIYRALTLAHEITDHEVRFVCDENSKVAVTKLAGYDYWLGIYKADEIVDRIIELKPDLVVNDILDTDREYIQKLRNHGVRVVNFEDCGTGASLADYTINELYDDPQIPGENIFWGRDYFFVREEFYDARPHTFEDHVTSVLITFGGADPSDFIRKILHKIRGFCAEQKIKIYIVTGGGYSYIKELEQELTEIKDPEIHYTHATGVMSHIMEQTQVAISSNGRTVYELAHMNIPSIVLSHHPRENTHTFALEQNGFIPIGLYKGLETEDLVLSAFKRLVLDVEYRKKYYQWLRPFDFTKNKQCVLNTLLPLLES